MPTAVSVQATLFESLVRCAKPDPELIAELRSLGYDADKPRPSYPAAVFMACQDAVLRHSYGSAVSKTAQREMGRDLVQRYFDTLVGKVVGTALKMAGPERAMKRVKLSFSSVFDPVDIQSEPLAPADWIVRFRGYPFPAEAAAGTCEVALCHAGAPSPRVEVARYEPPENFDLRIRW